MLAFRKMNWHVLRIAKAYFRYPIWFMTFGKSITMCAFLYHRDPSMHQKSQQSILKNFVSEFPVLSALKIPLCGLVIFIAVSTIWILTEVRSFKTFLKENYAIALDSCYLFTKKCWTWNWTADLMNTLQFKQIMTLTVC